MEHTVYLDNAATTFPKPEEVYEALDMANRELAFNAGRGTYNLAKKATDLIETTKKQILGVVCPNSVAEVIFTSSATVAFNQVIGGLEIQKGAVVYVSPFEHNAVMRTLHHAQKRIGFEIEVLETKMERGNYLQEDTSEEKNTSLILDLSKIEYQFAKKHPDYVFCTHVSNVTGYILPIETLCKMAKEYEAKTILDASQSIGLVDINMDKMLLDCVVFAGHKTLYGPLGIGGFVKKGSLKIAPFLAGGTGSDSLNLDMPIDGGLEPSSPNVVAIAGLSKALELLEGEKMGQLHQQEQDMTKKLLEGVCGIEGLHTYLPPLEAHVGIVALNVEGFQASDVGMLLDEDYNIAVRTGYHCAPLIHELLDDKEFGGVVRVSVGRFTTEEDVEKLIMALKEIMEG